jgi:cobalt/nickel transport system permease protein
MFTHALHSLHCGPSYLGRIDPRVRIAAAVLLALVVTIAKQTPTMIVALAAAAGLAALARISPGALFRRLLPLEILLAVLMTVLPWPKYNREGLMLATSIALKANAVVLSVAALIGTLDAVTLGHALAHFHVPQKLTQLMLFMVRYFDVLGREYARLRAAMKVRCFRPAMNRHSYRMFGYLVGMLLVRSFDRSERVLAAMKCRGFCGRYYMLDHFAYVQRRDAPFCAAMILLAAILLGLEWTAL